MSSEWKTVLLGELISHKKGFAFKSNDYVDAGVPVVRVSNFTDDSISFDDLKFVSSSIARINSSVSLRANDIVVATVGSWPNNPASVVGRTISVPTRAENALMNQNSVIIRSKSSSLVDQRFIYYQMKSKNFSNHVISKAQGSANQASISLDAIFSFPLYWPESDERASVVSILNALDHRITLLRETSATLEAIAQALFKSWFIDFDPVRAKMEGRAPEGMDEATAALFPDSLEETELGLVPTRWRRGKLGDVATLKGGKQLSKDAFSDHEPNPVFGGAGVMGYTAHRNATDFVITVGRVGAYCGQFFWHIGDAWVNNNASLIVPLSMVSPEWLLLWLKSVNMDVIKKGAAQPFVSNGDIAELPIIQPPIELFGLFGAVVAPIFARSQVQLQHSVELASLRDTLLPRLISGQICINEISELANA